MGKEEDVRTVQADVRSIKETLGWHRNIGWTIASVYAVVFASVLGWLLISYLPSQFSDKLPSDFKERFAKLEQNIANVQERLNRITPATLNQLIPEPDSKLPKAALATQLRKASNVIDVALRTEVAADPELLVPLQGRVSGLLDKYKSDAAVRTIAASTGVRLSGYKQASKGILEGLKPITSVQDLSQVANSSYIVGLTFGCPYHNAHFLRILPPFNPEQFVVFDVLVDGCDQKLDGPNWINVEFKGSTIEYDGGRLYLADVKFTDCTFAFGEDVRSQAALAQIRASKGEPVSVIKP